uniref:transposase n=1 Tax=Streptomyces chartreusis TaxID=1969 RepID=UPI003F4991A8
MCRARASGSAVTATARPPADRRTVVEATAWRCRTRAPWRDLPERFGNWNTSYKNVDRWSRPESGPATSSNPGDGSPGWRRRLDRVDRRSCVFTSTARPCPGPNQNVTIRSPTAASDLAADRLR